MDVNRCILLISLMITICVLSCADKGTDVSPPATAGSAAVLNTTAERETNAETIGVTEAEAKDDPEVKIKF